MYNFDFNEADGSNSNEFHFHSGYQFVEVKCDSVQLRRQVL